MASAVLSSRNEPYWGEREVCMRQFPNNRTNNPHLNPQSNPNPNHIPSRFQNPNYSIGRQIHDVTVKTDLRQRNEPLPRPPLLPPAVINDAPSLKRNKEGAIPPRDCFHQEYMTLHLSSYSRSGLKELKKRLISDLERVRTLLTRIETRKLEFRSGFHSPQFRPTTAVETNLQQPFDPQAENRTAKGTQKNRSSGSVTLTRKGKGKKIQKLSGQKRALALANDGRETKRPVAAVETVATATEADKALGTMMKECKQILMTLMKQKYGWVFNKPVDVERLRLYDYYQIIKHPMDLGTIKTRLNKKVYKSALEFAADVRLTFDNAMKYNPKGQDVHTMAESMLAAFEEMFGPVYQQCLAEHRKLVAEKTSQINNWVQQEPVITMPQPILLSSPSCQNQNEQVFLPPVVQDKKGKLPKPKAKDPNKRPMTDEEKLKLGSNLQNLPQEKMEQMVHIVRKRNPHLVQEGDEIELDFESLDNETLWDLDRFVNYHKKAVSKMKRQEVVEDAVVIQEGHKVKMICIVYRIKFDFFLFELTDNCWFW